MANWSTEENWGNHEWDQSGTWHSDRSRGWDGWDGYSTEENASGAWHSDGRGRGSWESGWPDRSRGEEARTEEGDGNAHEGDAAEREIFDLNYFRGYTDFTATYKQHNIALKWFRDSSEREGRTQVIFSNTRDSLVPQIIHGKGPLYSFNEDEMFSWRWQEMVAQLDDASMAVVVEGPPDAPRSRGLIQCMIQQTEIYDHKRHCAQSSSDLMKVWNFVLVRDDGTSVSLHPNFNDTKVSCKFGQAGVDLELPRTGKGGTSGPGTFRHFANKHTDVTLRFDARKA